MPFGFERINESSQRPNVLINFIKPLEGPDKGLAEEFLSRIAAQCYPVMKANHIAVMSLEEYEPNAEFLGRNFNAGECIQLVLKTKQGQWLGFRYVQMVMMHELAHCKQMNHSRDFWKVRNGFAEEMEGLWKKRYSGEGVWGRGQNLATGSFLATTAVEPGDVPQHLCGGTYRRRGRKRKRGQPESSESQTLTYAERQQRRIAKKFGKHGEGNEVGEDELLRGALETGHRHQGKPRVANSKRGRELRAQAALARFDRAKLEEERAKQESVQSSESDAEWSETEYGDGEQSETGLIKVCGGEDEEDENADQEAQELHALSKQAIVKAAVKPKESIATKAIVTVDPETESEAEKETLADEHRDRAEKQQPAAPVTKPIDSGMSNSQQQPAAPVTTIVESGNSSSVCGICSLENEAQSLLCMACANVLRPQLVRDSWRCTSETCRGTNYRNAGDAGRCGICGSKRAQKAVEAAMNCSQTIGTNILRWD